MFDLIHANEGVHKAAAMQGVRSGKYERVFDSESDGVIAKVYNKNHPDGLEIYSREAGEALNWTWKEINNR